MVQIKIFEFFKLQILQEKLIVFVKNKLNKTIVVTIQSDCFPRRHFYGKIAITNDYKQIPCFYSRETVLFLL